MHEPEGYRKLCGLVPTIRNAAAASIYESIGCAVAAGDIKVPAQSGCAAVSAAKFACPIDTERIAALSANMPKADGIPVFEAVALKNGKLCFRVSFALLREYVHLSLRCFGSGGKAPTVPERLFLPVNGVMPDEEASGYAMALLLAYARTGKETVPCDASRDALLRCLILPGAAEGSKLRSALASAVRSALTACGKGVLGGEEAGAMALLLGFAAERLNFERTQRR